MTERTHAYIGIKDGIVQAVIADTGDKRIASDVATLIRQGCTIQRVPIAQARNLLFETWPGERT